MNKNEDPQALNIDPKNVKEGDEYTLKGNVLVTLKDGSKKKIRYDGRVKVTDINESILKGQNLFITVELLEGEYKGLEGDVEARHKNNATKGFKITSGGKRKSRKSKKSKRTTRRR